MRVTVSIPDEIGRRVEELAEKEGASVSSIYARAVEEHVKEKRRQEAFEAINALIGETNVAPDAIDELHRMRRESDRTFE